MAAIVLARAAFETYAALWYLDEKVKTALEQNKLGDLDDYVNRLLCGTYEWDDFPKPIRVGKFVEFAERIVPGFKEQYDKLSDYAHPNARGTSSFYSTINCDENLVDFGPHEPNIAEAKAICISNLNVTLMLFRETYDHISEFMQEVIKLCEKEIPPREPVPRD